MHGSNCIILLGSVEAKDMGTQKIDFRQEFKWRFTQVIPQRRFYIDTHLGNCNLGNLIDRIWEPIATKEIKNLGKRGLV